MEEDKIFCLRRPASAVSSLWLIGFWLQLQTCAPPYIAAYYNRLLSYKERT